MESVNTLFLQAIREALQKKTVDWEKELSPEQWRELFALASRHRVLPLVYEAVIRSNSAKNADPQIFQAAKKQTMQTVMLQARKTNDFLKLLQDLISAGVTPLVVKGIICRELYPNPDYRMSGDEDVIIPEDQFSLCHEAMHAFGMKQADPAQGLDKYEIAYVQKESHLYIELHKRLFPPESDVYGDLNRYFANIFERSIMQTIQGTAVPAMNHTDHLFYLICHCFKHFLHSGFGIRQVCDICLYANAYGPQIDWMQIQKQCKEIDADIFAATLFRIGENYLIFQPEKTGYPVQWRELELEETAMLEDLLDSGVFGASSMNRKHSSNMTLQAVWAHKQGKKSGKGVLKSVFPSAKSLSGRYHYLTDKPYLLPLAWADRILKYKKETASGSLGNNALESVKIGNRRVELLKKYGIIGRKEK